MIESECKACGAQMSVPDSLTGQSETCPNCGAMVTVPELDVSVDRVMEDEPTEQNEKATAAAVQALPSARGSCVKRWPRLLVLWFVPTLFMLLAVSIIILGDNHEKVAAGCPYTANAIIMIVGTWLCQTGKIRLAVVYACCAVLQYGIAAYSIVNWNSRRYLSDDLFAGFLVAMLFAVLALACGIRPLGILAVKFGERVRSPFHKVLRIVLIVSACFLVLASLVIYALEKPGRQSPRSRFGGMVVVDRTSTTEMYRSRMVEGAKDFADLWMNPVGWSAWLRTGTTRDTIRTWRREVERGNYEGIGLVIVAGRVLGVVLLSAFAIFLFHAKPPRSLP